MKYVEFIKEPDKLIIKLLNAGHEFLSEQRDEMGWKRGTYYIFRDLIEWQLCNGWEMVPPEDIAALTSAPILSDEVTRDDHGKLLTIGAAYWSPEYQVACAIGDLLTNGSVVFTRAKEVA